MHKLQEHEQLKVERHEKYDKLSLISWTHSLNSDEWGYFASYKIGAEWVDKEEALIVTAKRGMENIDFLEMFMTCFSSNLALESFSKIYSVDYDKPSINAPSLKGVLSPLIMLHFLGVVSRIKTLKRGYVHHSENQKKVKGHIALMKNERKNIIPKRYDRIYCEYDEYSVDIPENRLLKKAILYTQRMMQSIGEGNQRYDKIKLALRKCLAQFENVNCDVDMKEVSLIRRHKLFKEYAEAIRLAKTILRHFDYSINKVSSQEDSVVPFILDMSLLYEHYVYGLLYEAYQNKIVYQFSSLTGKPDFIYRSQSFKAILDTKYIPKYEKQELETYVVRQLSGYSRDLKILKYLGYDNVSEETLLPNVPCVIIYPKEGRGIINPFLKVPLKELCNKSVKGLVLFYEIAIPVPTLKD
ncbi:MAG: McrC family protein [Prevotella sp.]|nr:McrC family protein [Prevotella sp.]